MIKNRSQGVFWYGLFWGFFGTMFSGHLTCWNGAFIPNDWGLNPSGAVSGTQAKYFWGWRRTFPGIMKCSFYILFHFFCFVQCCVLFNKQYLEAKPTMAIALSIHPKGVCTTTHLKWIDEACYYWANYAVIIGNVMLFRYMVYTLKRHWVTVSTIYTCYISVLTLRSGSNAQAFKLILADLEMTCWCWKPKYSVYCGTSTDPVVHQLITKLSNPDHQRSVEAWGSIPMPSYLMSSCFTELSEDSENSSASTHTFLAVDTGSRISLHSQNIYVQNHTWVRDIPVSQVHIFYWPVNPCAE